MNATIAGFNRRRAAGFTLTEMMVAMVIGLLLTVAISQVFLTSKRNIASTDDSARVQENIRFVLQMMTRHLRQAGYKSSPTTLSSTTFPTGTNGAGLFGTEGGGTTSDSIKIRLMGSGAGTSPNLGRNATTYMTANDSGADGLIVDCRGYMVDSNLIALNEYTIAAGANGRNALFCNGSELVADIDNMQILYGEETDAVLSDTNYGPNYYVNAGSVVNMDSVTSVKLALLFRSPTATSDVVISKTYSLLGTTIPAFNDQVSRRAISITVSLRNRPVKDIGGS